MWAHLDDQPALNAIRLRESRALLIEAPLTDDDGCPQPGSIPEGCLRLFRTYEDACIYCEQAQAWFQDIELSVVEIQWNQLDGFIQQANVQSMMEYGHPCRLDICTIEWGEHPKPVDTLWGPNNWIN